MAEDNNVSVWHLSQPSVWPKAPPRMSFSTLMDLEACPRRWALCAADYPNVWKRHGYPSMPHVGILEGTIVHLTLKRIMDALVRGGCPSLFDESTIGILRELGGFTAVIQNSLELALGPYEANPRAAPFLDMIRNRLAARVPELRPRVQRFLSRIKLERHVKRLEGHSIHQGGQARHQLQNGSHSEVELQVVGLRWVGFIDLLTLAPTRCEIRDFKNGTPKPKHEFQLRIYALLWSRDNDLNPSGRLADKLVLSYDGGDVEIPAPSESALSRLEDELRERTVSSFDNLQTYPPKAQPSSENCEYCSVRHLCEEYWHWNFLRFEETKFNDRSFADLQIKITALHGPNSWDGIVESPSDLKVGGSFLLRTANLQFNLQLGQRLRILNAHISVPNQEETLVEKGRTAVVATMGTNTEAFLIP